MTYPELLEKLASLEHEQWLVWSKGIAEDLELLKTDPKLARKKLLNRLERWQSLWVPYDELSEEMKELDREWAKLALRYLEEFCEEAKVGFVD